MKGPGIRLRRTTPADLDFVLALEHHPDQKPFIGQWTREQHLDVIARSDREHWIIERAGDHESQGYVIAYDVRDAGYGIYIKRIAITEKSKGIGREALREFLAHAFRDSPRGVGVPRRAPPQRARAARVRGRGLRRAAALDRRVARVPDDRRSGSATTV